MHHFVIDVNLPGHVPPYESEQCIYVSEIDNRLPDGDIWLLAKNHDYTIISKDADFSNRILLADPPPKVIHIRFGNVRLRDFISLMSALWPEILAMHRDHKLVNVYKDRIEGIN